MNYSSFIIIINSADAAEAVESFVTSKQVGFFALMLQGGDQRNLNLKNSSNKDLPSSLKWWRCIDPSRGMQKVLLNDSRPGRSALLSRRGWIKSVSMERSCPASTIDAGETVQGGALNLLKNRLLLTQATLS